LPSALEYNPKTRLSPAVGAVGTVKFNIRFPNIIIAVVETLPTVPAVLRVILIFPSTHLAVPVIVLKKSLLYPDIYGS